MRQLALHAKNDNNVALGFKEKFLTIFPPFLLTPFL